MNRALDALFARCSEQAVPFGRFADGTYAELSDSMRTGDLFLYNARAETQTPAERGKFAVALLLARLLALLPCSTYASLACGADAPDSSCDEDDDEYFHRNRDDAVTSVLAIDVQQWTDAALVTCAGAPAKAHVFVPGEDGVFRLTPLDAFVASLGAGRQCGAVRHLMIRDELCTSNGENGRLFSQRRAQLSERIGTFQRHLVTQSQRRAPQTIDWAVAAALAYRGLLTSPDAMGLSGSGVPLSNDAQLALMRASGSYTALQTLYAAQVLRVAPRAIDSAQLLQERHESALARQLASDYQFGSERVISFQ